jgi:putative heme iron utilization protein
MSFHDTPQKTDLLYDPSLPTPSHAEHARTLAASVGTGTLGTLALEPKGYPYTSLVTFGLDAASPVFILSELAEHTKNLRGDARASLLVAESGATDPLAHGRVTLIGRCQTTIDERSKAALLERHPSAAGYASFRDFAFWKMEVESLRYIGGFGRMSWCSAEDWAKATPDPLAPHAAGIIGHMNADHAAALVAYCRAFSRASDTTEATMTSVDRYGFEMSALTAAGRRPIRVAFSRPLTTPDEVRQEMVALVKTARARLPS